MPEEFLQDIKVLLGFLVRTTLSDSAASPTNPTYGGHLAHHCSLPVVLAAPRPEPTAVTTYVVAAVAAVAVTRKGACVVIGNLTIGAP